MPVHVWYPMISSLLGSTLPIHLLSTARGYLMRGCLISDHNVRACSSLKNVRVTYALGDEDTDQQAGNEEDNDKDDDDTRLYSCFCPNVNANFVTNPMPATPWLLSSSIKSCLQGLTAGTATLYYYVKLEIQRPYPIRPPISVRIYSASTAGPSMTPPPPLTLEVKAKSLST